VRHRYEEWMANTIHQLMLAGRLRKPSYATLAQWVMDSWDEVDPRLIVNSFKCCGVSVKMDGTEDDLVFDYESLSENLADENNENSKVVGLDINSEEYEEVDGINN
ncbi:29391_t:CDS:1, partial [Racocetra persica]